MSTKTPVVTGDRLVRILRRADFGLLQLSVRITCFVHAGRTLKRGSLAAILDDVDMTADDLRRLL